MSTRLIEALRDALHGQGGFQLLEQGVATAAERGRLDLRPRHFVLWPMENKAAAVWQLLEALEAGVVPLLLPAATPPAMLEKLRARFPGFGLLTEQGIDWPVQPVHAAPGLFFGLLTSGSTGEPKAIVTGAERLAHGVRAIHDAQGLANVAATGVLLPLAYSYACVNQLFWAVQFGRSLHLPGPLADLARCFDILRVAGVDMLCMVPHQARMLARLAASAAPLPDVRILNFAGAPFPQQEYGALRALFPQARLLNNYGCAEAMPRLTCIAMEGPDAPLAQVGRAIGDVELRIAGGDPSGPIEFKGSSTALGTVGPDGSLQPFGEWIASGDLGAIDGDGLRVLGRHDQVVKIGGERVSLLSLEAALKQCGAAQALAWLRNDGGMERVAAVMQLESAPALPVLLPALRALLPRTLLPAEIYWTPHWPLNANQKTDRPLLQAQAAQGLLQQAWPAAR